MRIIIVLRTNDDRKIKVSVRVKLVIGLEVVEGEVDLAGGITHSECDLIQIEQEDLSFPIGFFVGVVK